MNTCFVALDNPPLIWSKNFFLTLFELSLKVVIYKVQHEFVFKVGQTYLSAIGIP